MAEATISSKHQIVIPREARQALGVKAGDKILVVVRGERVVMLPKPASHRDAIRGLAKKPFPSDHLAKERRDWR